MELQRIIHEEFLYSHEELSKHDRGIDAPNQQWFQSDFTQGLLDRYTGTFVAYHKGVLCGQSKDGKGLYEEAQQYFGSSNLAVFLVPSTWEDIDEALKSSFGELHSWTREFE